MNDPRTLAVTLFRSVTSTDGARVALTWSELCEALGSHAVCASKSDAPGWSPATFDDDARGRPVESVACLVFDVDGALPELTQDAAWFAHTTHSHTAESPRWRVVVLTDRPHAPEEHERVWRSVAGALGLTPDEATKDASRFYWAPSHAPGAPHETRSASGRSVPLGDTPGSGTTPWVERHPPPGRPPPAPLEARPELGAPPAPPRKSVEFLPSSAPIDLESLRARVSAMAGGPSKVKMQTLVNFGELPRQGSRNAWMHSAFSIAGKMGLSPEVGDYLADIFANRVELHDAETSGYWKGLALNSFSRAAAERAHKDALTTTLAKVLGGSTPDDWRHDLITTTKNEVTKATACGANLTLIFLNDDAFKSLRWNTLKCEMEFTTGPFVNVPATSLDVAVTDWLFQTPEYRISMPRQEVIARLLAAARTRPFDPVKNYLEGLVWDGVERLNGLLYTYCGVDYGLNNHCARISRRFMVGAVARAYRPGCQMDTVLLLQGAQGLGKTSFVRALGGEFMAELHMDPSNKDTLQAIAGRWFVELSELASARKTDVESMRAFITRKVDVIRLPYGKVTEEFPRRCVFIGTTNEDTPLTDAHGNRRYWPVTVGKVDVFALERDRDQLFAEAVAAFKAGERWWLDDGEQLQASEEARMYTESDTWSELIRDWLYKQPVETRPTKVSAHFVAQRILMLDPHQMTRGTMTRIGFALKSLSFVRIGAIEVGKRSSSEYETPKAFLEEVKP